MSAGFMKKNFSFLLIFSSSGLLPSLGRRWYPDKLERERRRRRRRWGGDYQVDKDKKKKK